MKLIQKIISFTECSFGYWDGVDDTQERIIEIDVDVIQAGEPVTIIFQAKEERTLILHEGDWDTPSYSEEKDSSIEITGDTYNTPEGEEIESKNIPFPDGGRNYDDLMEIINEFYGMDEKEANNKLNK